MISSASIHTRCSPALIEQQKIACRTDGGIKVCSFEVICGKHFCCIQPCPLQASSYASHAQVPFLRAVVGADKVNGFAALSPFQPKKAWLGLVSVLGCPR